MGQFIDMTGWVMKEHGVPESKWTVIEKDVTPTKSRATKWVCQCECGTVRSVVGSDLRNGKSKCCGCVRAAKTAQRNREGAKDITGQRFGYLEALYPTDKRQNTFVVWVCKCHNCGRLHEACLHDLTKGCVKSCGCMTESHGEYNIKQLLKEHKIPYETEKTFDSCRNPETEGMFRFDFWVNNSHSCQ